MKNQRIFWTNGTIFFNQNISHRRGVFLLIFLVICEYTGEKWSDFFTEWIDPFLDVLKKSKPFSTQVVLHRPKQVVIRRSNVWTIMRRGAELFFLGALKKYLTHLTKSRQKKCCSKTPFFILCKFFGFLLSEISFFRLIIVGNHWL